MQAEGTEDGCFHVGIAGELFAVEDAVGFGAAAPGVQNLADGEAHEQGGAGFAALAIAHQAVAVGGQGTAGDGAGFQGDAAQVGLPQDGLVGVAGGLVEHIGFRGFHGQGQARKDVSDQGCPFVNIVVEMGTTNAEIRQATDQCFQRFGEYYRQIVRDAKRLGISPDNLDEDRAVQTLINVMNGGMVSSKIKNRPEEILAMAPVAELVLKG